MMRGKYFMAMVILVSVSTAHSNDGSLEERRLNELRETALRLQKIIVEKDTDGFLQHVQPANDFLYDWVKSQLARHDSLLYGRLFNSAVLNRHIKSKPPRISVRDYFLRAKDLRLDVSFYREGGQKKIEWGYVIYYSSNFHRRDWPAATFFYENGRWWITDIFEEEANS